MQAQKQPFTNKTVTLHPGDTFYLFSDGYPDQFGGPKGKKFMIKRFKNLLLSLEDQAMEKQKKVLEKTLTDWMDEGKEEQIDDVCVIGVRL
jgi:serine phosphatase RsbU (regulator of sigma subunit)